MDSIKILGAGISGLAAGINLAENGYDVEIFERAKDSGTRFRGDLQGLENWSSKTDATEELKHAGIKINFDYDPFKKVSFTNSEEMVTVDFKVPFFYLVKRGIMKNSLDQGLKEQALEKGVRIHFGATAREQNMDIIATGPRTREIFVIDKGIIFSTDMQDIAVALTNDTAAYKGYSYLLVTKGYGCMCSVVFRKTDLIDRCFNKTREIFEKMFKFEISGPKQVGGIGSFSLEKNFERNGTLYVGEAAGIQDPLWGFGIRSSLVSGYLAAKSIIDKTNYQKLVIERFGDYRKAGLVNRFLWEKLGSLNYKPLFSRFHKMKDPHQFMLNAYKLSMKHKLLFPVARRYLKKQYPNLRI